MRRRFAVILSAVLAANGSALATEQTIKNDSVVDYGQAVIVGDFAPSEIAAVRLTAPISGTIVAVQVLWLEGTPGHLPVIESAIYIWQGNTFPAPGGELAFLDSPALTPGGFNEFRYLDEAGTIPLSV